MGLHRGRDFAAYEFSYRVGMDFKYADAGLLRNRCRYQVVSVSHGLDGVPVVDIDSSGGSLTELVTSLFDRFDPAGSETAEMLSAKVTRRLKGDHGDFVREPDSWLESQPLAASHPLRFENGDVVTWRSGALDLDEVAELLDYLNDVVERLPEVRSGS
ncbi:MAG: hypothetical protein ACRDQF_17535 [Thermocrispum sp.]